MVSAHLTGALLANSAVAHGLSQVMGDLLTFPVGNEFYWVRIPSALAGRAFADALTELKRDHDCLPVALEIDGRYVTNPPADHVLSQGSRML